MDIASLCSDTPRRGSMRSPVPSGFSTPSVAVEDDCFSNPAMSTSMTSVDSSATLEPDVRLAVEALEGLRAGDTSVHGHHRGPSEHQSPAFLERVAHYPLVSSAVKAYESGKSSNKGFKYGADVFESVAKPVVRKLEPLDNFACRQLDRIEGRRSMSGGEMDLEAAQLTKTMSNETTGSGKQLPQPSFTGARWQNMLTGASGYTLSWSDDSMRSLHYCVSWLQWAGSHLQGLLHTLCEHLRARECHVPLPTSSGEYEQQQQSGQYVTGIKREIIGTLRKVVDIVSTYAGNALPEPARAHVRSYVLGLPSRWASKQQQQQQAGQPRADGPNDVKQQRDVEEGRRVSSLAQESIDMLHNITGIVSRTLHQAEDWSQWRSRYRGQPPPDHHYPAYSPAGHGHGPSPDAQSQHDRSGREPPSSFVTNPTHSESRSYAHPNPV